MRKKLSRTERRAITRAKITPKKEILNKLKDLEDEEEIVYNKEEHTSSGHVVIRKTKGE